LPVQLLATIVQSLLLVNVGMELAMSTIVIGALYKKPHAEFALTESESSWYGKNTTPRDSGRLK